MSTIEEQYLELITHKPEHNDEIDDVHINKFVKFMDDNSNQIKTLIELKHPNGSYGIHIACQWGWYDVIKRFLELGVDPNIRDDNSSSFGDTPLLLSTYSGDTNCVELLLKYGADPNMSDTHSNHTPLFNSYMADDNDAIKLLLMYGADPHKPINNGLSVISYMILNGDYNKYMIA